MPANPPLIHCSGWLRAKRTRPVLPHLVPQGGAVCEGVQYISAYLVLSCFFNQLVSTDIARATGCRRYVSRAFIVSQPSFPFVWPSSLLTPHPSAPSSSSLPPQNTHLGLEIGSISMRLLAGASLPAHRPSSVHVTSLRTWRRCSQPVHGRAEDIATPREDVGGRTDEVPARR